MRQKRVLRVRGGSCARTRAARKALKVLVAFACLFVFVGALAGCRHTDALTEIFYTQDADVVDYDNPAKIYVPVRQSERVDESTPPTERDDAPTDTERQQEIPDAAEADRTSNEQPRPEVVAGPSMNYHEAGNAANSAALSTSPTGANDAGEAPGRDAGGQGTEQSGNDEQGDSQDKDPTRNDDDQVPSGPAGPGTLYDARNGTLEELPQAETVAAAGDLAAIVATVGGGQALAGGPETLAYNSRAAMLFGEITPVFEGDGMSAGSLDVEAVIARSPDAVLVPDGCAALDDGSVQALVDAGIDVALLPSLRSAGGMRACVDQVGQVLVGPSGPSGKSPRDTADAYLQFYDRVMSGALASHGGAFAVDTFDENTSGALGAGAVTLYIDGWDDASVVVTSFPAGNVLVDDWGVAYCSRAASEGPVATFMSAGGAVNNVLFWQTRTWLEKDILPVLQFNENFVSYRWGDSSVPLAGGTGITGGAYRVLTYAADDSGCLGQDAFPAVIVRTQAIADALQSARSRAGSLYWPGQQLDQGVGAIVDGEYLPMNTLPGYGIYVNPAGYLGSWADGGMESVLESAWVASKFGGYPEADVGKLVDEYYRTFYGIDLGDQEVERILSGALAD